MDTHTMKPCHCICSILRLDDGLLVLLIPVLMLSWELERDYLQVARVKVPGKVSVQTNYIYKRSLETRLKHGDFLRHIHGFNYPQCIHCNHQKLHIYHTCIYYPKLLFSKLTFRHIISKTILCCWNSMMVFLLPNSHHTNFLTSFWMHMAVKLWFQDVSKPCLYTPVAVIHLCFSCFCWQLRLRTEDLLKCTP